MPQYLDWALNGFRPSLGTQTWLLKVRHLAAEAVLTAPQAGV